MEDMRNEFTQKKTFSINDDDLEELIKKEYPQWNYGDIATSLEATNGSYHSEVINGRDLYRSEVLKRYKESGSLEFDTVWAILDDWCKRGLLESGEYVINVSW